MHACMHLSTISTTRASVLHLDHEVYSKQKLKLPIGKRLSLSSSLFSSSSSSSSSNTLVNIKRCKYNIACKAQEAVNEVQVATDSSWKNLVIGNQSPILVEFWPPCGVDLVAPVIDDLAKEYAGMIACYKVNTDDCPIIATQYGTRSNPTVLFFKNGEKKESVIGA